MESGSRKNHICSSVQKPTCYWLRAFLAISPNSSGRILRPVNEELDVEVICLLVWSNCSILVPYRGRPNYSVNFCPMLKDSLEAGQYRQIIIPPFEL